MVSHKMTILTLIATVIFYNALIFLLSIAQLGLVTNDSVYYVGLTYIIYMYGGAKSSVS